MKRALITLLLICSFSFPVHCFAKDLMEVYQDAFTNDAIFKAARAELQAQAQLFPMALSSLLPQLLFTGNVSRTGFRANFANPRLNNPGSLPSVGVNRHKDYTLSVSQTIFNLSQWGEVKNARATVKQAVANFHAAFQDLIIRTAQAYFNVLNAHDNFRFKSAQAKALKNKLDQYRARYKVGLIAITDVYLTQTDYEIVKAERIEAQNDLENRLEDLKVITGKIYPELKGAGDSLPLISPFPTSIERWTEVAIKQNYKILAAQYATLAAKERFDVELGKGFPKLSANGSYAYTEDSNLNFDGAAFGPAHSRLETVGLNLEYPILQGGRVIASTRQVTHLYHKADAQKEQVLRETVAFTRQSYLGVLASIGQVKAYKQSIFSSQSALETNEAGYLVGTKTVLDVLTAQSSVFESQSNHSKNQYNYLMNTLKLKQAAGTLKVEDLMNLNQWLVSKSAFSESYLVKLQLLKEKSKVSLPQPKHKKNSVKPKRIKEKKPEKKKQVEIPKPTNIRYQ